MIFYLLLTANTAIVCIYYILGFSYTRSNILRILFLFEILFLLFSFLFLIISVHYSDIYGQVVVLYLLTIAAVEAAIGLALIYIYYKLWRTVKLSTFSKIKG